MDLRELFDSTDCTVVDNFLQLFVDIRRHGVQAEAELEKTQSSLSAKEEECVAKEEISRQLRQEMKEKDAEHKKTSGALSDENKDMKQEICSLQDKERTTKEKLCQVQTELFNSEQRERDLKENLRKVENGKKDELDRIKNELSDSKSREDKLKAHAGLLQENLLKKEKELVLAKSVFEQKEKTFESTEQRYLYNMNTMSKRANHEHVSFVAAANALKETEEKNTEISGENLLLAKEKKEMQVRESQYKTKMNISEQKINFALCASLPIQDNIVLNINSARDDTHNRVAKDLNKINASASKQNKAIETQLLQQSVKLNNLISQNRNQERIRQEGVQKCIEQLDDRKKIAPMIADYQTSRHIQNKIMGFSDDSNPAMSKRFKSELHDAGVELTAVQKRNKKQKQRKKEARVAKKLKSLADAEAVMIKTEPDFMDGDNLVNGPGEHDLPEPAGHDNDHLTLEENLPLPQ